MIINSSYFVGDIYLSQVGLNASMHVNNNERLQSFIDKYEPKILIKALGRRLYNEFISNLQEDGTVKTDADQKWNDLLNGAEYEKGGVTYYWRGLVDDNKSLIAYYVYYHYVNENIEQQTTLGTVKADAKNSSSASAIPTVVEAWRNLYDWYMGDNQFTPQVYYHRGFYVEDWYSGNNSKEVSLYKFLSDNAYDNWFFSPIENKNTWGL